MTENPLKEYDLECIYTTESIVNYKIFARSLEDAGEIVRRYFYRAHTEDCKLQRIIENQKSKPNKEQRQ